MLPSYENNSLHSMKGLVLDRITYRVSLLASAHSDRASVCIKARFLWIIISKATCKAMLTLATDTGESYHQDYSFPPLHNH